jgi:hypothetical protein
MFLENFNKLQYNRNNIYLLKLPNKIFVSVKKATIYTNIKHHNTFCVLTRMPTFYQEKKIEIT